MKTFQSWFFLICVILTSTLLGTSLSAEEKEIHTPTKTYEYPFPVDELIPKPSPENDRFFSEFMNMLASLGLIIALMFIVAWFLKRFANTRLEQANQSSLIKILEKRNLSPKTVVYLLEIQGTAYFISESVNGVTSLSEFPIASEEPPKPTFEQLLEKK